MELERKVIEKFLKYVDMREEDECWPWKAKINNVGRGIFTFDRKRKGQPRKVSTYCAHHVSYQFFVGDADVRYLDHSCGNLWCCNPNHLYPRTLEKRLLDNVEYSDGDDPCWLWKKFILPNGYGTIHLNGESELAHRVSYKFFNGKRIPHGMQVRHTCHNKSCINPDHLIIGTHKDNMRDMTQANRQAKGERIANSKLTLKEVKRIKNMLDSGNYSQKELARTYGVSGHAISDIKRGRTWNWLDGENNE